VGPINRNDHTTRDYRLARARQGVLAMLLLAALGGCAYNKDASFDAHYQRYKAQLPERDKVFVCSSYGCRTQTGFRFTEADIAKLRSLMSAKKTATAEDERHAVADTLGWMGRRVGAEVGTAADRPADDMAGNGDPTQMDCVDLATNLTSYLLILERHELLRHHSVGPVFTKEDLRRGFDGWPHYASTLVEAKSGQRYAVDGWLLASGKPPEVVEVEKWYIDDSDIVFGSKGIVTSANTP
jgi:hypothetical protein